MADYFEIPCRYRDNIYWYDDPEQYDKVKHLFNCFGSKIIGVWTTDGKAPAKDGSNFDLTNATDVYGIVSSRGFAESSTGIDFCEFGNSSKYTSYYPNELRFWKGNEGVKLVAFTNLLTYEAGGFFLSSRDRNNPHGYAVGSYEIKDDGSYTAYVYWVMQRNNGLWESIRWSEADIKADVFGDTNKPDTPDDNGDYNDESDPVTIPDTPIIDMCDVGMVKIWKPTIANLEALGNQLWSTNFFDNIVKSVLSPMDTVIALNIVPSIDKATVGGSAEIKLGNYPTGINCNYLSSQFMTVDMGSITISKYWGSALDYSPFTSIQIFLPYIGTVKISPDDVMGKSVHIVYKIDVVTGQMVAMIATTTTSGQESVLYSFTGTCSITIPVTGANYTQAYLGVIQGVAGVVGGATTAVGGVVSAAKGLATTGKATGLANVGIGGNAMIDGASQIASSKIQYDHGSSCNMTAGYLGVQSCYAIITRPRQSLAENYNNFVGYPSNITSQLGSLKGFTAVEEIHLSNIPATDSEKAEIETLLKGGVII